MAAKKKKRRKSKFKATILNSKRIHVLLEAPGKEGGAPWRAVSSFPNRVKAQKFKREIESE
jgi:hypothetical protein